MTREEMLAEFGATQRKLQVIDARRAWYRCRLHAVDRVRDGLLRRQGELLDLLGLKLSVPLDGLIGARGSFPFRGGGQLTAPARPHPFDQAEPGLTAPTTASVN